jgi:CheY-like chemotaxis protein
MNSPVQAPRVLLVDDDATLRRLVAMMLEDLPIELLCCSSVADALDALRAQTVQLLITDWMMPGDSGLVLLQTLAREPALRGEARLVVFSAGLDAAVQSQLAGLGVWRTLAKPVAVQAMEDCVCEALGWQAPGAARAIAHHFAGDAALYAAFRSDFLRQLPGDMQDCKVALESHEAAALRCHAHNLKSVLRTLGHEDAALLAQDLEDAAAVRDWGAAQTTWPGLRQACLSLI